MGQRQPIASSKQQVITLWMAFSEIGCSGSEVSCPLVEYLSIYFLFASDLQMLLDILLWLIQKLLQNASLNTPLEGHPLS